MQVGIVGGTGPLGQGLAPRWAAAGVPVVVGGAACQHLPAGDQADLGGTQAADVLVCSDHPEGTASAMELIGRIDGLRPLDAGSLASAGPIEAFTAVLVTLNIRYRAHTMLRLGGIAS